MAPAADEVAAALADVALADPKVPVVHNVDAAPNSQRVRDGVGMRAVHGELADHPAAELELDAPHGELGFHLRPDRRRPRGPARPQLAGLVVNPAEQVAAAEREAGELVALHEHLGLAPGPRPAPAGASHEALEVVDARLPPLGVGVEVDP